MIRPRLPRFTLRFLLLATFCIAAVLASEYRWVHQRRLLRAEGDAVWQCVGNFSNSAFMERRGISKWREFVLWLFNEPHEETFFVYMILNSGEELEFIGEGYRVRGVEEFPKAQRASRLFPEANIEITRIFRNQIVSGEFDSRLERIVSDE